MQSQPVAERGGGAPSVAVLIPCRDEEATVGAVVAGFRAVLPDAVVYVYDNASADGTARTASEAGAVVRSEPAPGKGNVVRRMFADIDADLYVMVDGDGTYDPGDAPAMLKVLADQRLDMVVGARRGIGEASGAGHAFGNRLFNSLYRRLFGQSFTDVFSGYRAFTRRFVKSFPAVSTGFETETEISVHASQLRVPAAEVPVAYASRPEGSASKLRVVADGARILASFAVLTKETRPLLFFGSIGTVLAVAAVVLGIPLVVTYLDTGLVPRIPTAVIVVGMLVVAALSVFAGVILDSLARSRVEQKRLHYLGAGTTR